MEGQNEKRELLEEVGQDRNQIPFTDFLHRTDDFELGHLIHGIDMVDPFDSIQVALMDRIDAQISGASMGLGLPAFAEAGERRTGLLKVLTNLAVARPVS